MSGQKERAVIEYLLERIRNGTWKVGSRIPSEYRLAEKFGIDKGTANRAVSTLVTQGYLKRTRGAGGTILLHTAVFPRFRFVYTGVLPVVHSFYARLTMGLMESAYAAECSMTILPCRNLRNFETFEERLQMLDPDLLFIGGEVPPFELPDKPVIAMDSLCMRGRGKNIHLLNPDNYEAGRLMIDEIWKRGHRHAAHCFKPTPPEVEKLRFEGAKDRAAELGMEFLPLDKTTLPANPLACRHFLPELLRKVSVIICENDISAADFIGLFRRCGIRVPEDVSVCGYISGPEFHHFHRIASVDFSPYELGEYAVSLALRILNGETGQPQEEILPVSFQDGETLVNLASYPFPALD